jgi:hypothetical protein
MESAARLTPWTLLLSCRRCCTAPCRRCLQYTIEEYNKVGDYYGSETDGYYNSDEEYYSDAYDQ